MQQLPPRTAFSREGWMTLLAQAPLQELEEHWHSIRQPSFQWIKRPEYGAAMVRARASGTGGLFNLGEVTVTRCTLQIETSEIGVAYVMGRSKRHAALAAILDGLMQRETAAGVLEVSACITALARSSELRRRDVLRQTYSSKVDFFMLAREGGEE